MREIEEASAEFFSEDGKNFSQASEKLNGVLEIFSRAREKLSGGPEKFSGVRDKPSGGAEKFSGAWEKISGVAESFCRGSEKLPVDALRHVISMEYGMRRLGGRFT